jgi:site-specific DNA recombinase
MQANRTQRPTRAAIYTRVSTTRQAEEGFSLDEQERRALAHIQRTEGWQHVGTYREEGVSGAKATRPELDRLLAGLDEIDALVVPSLDRLGRSTRHLLELYEQLEDAGVVSVSLRESLDTSTPVGRLIRTVLSAVAEFERDIGRERTSDGIAGRASTEGKPWGAPALGYRQGADGHWEVEPAEAAIVRRVFAMVMERGLTYSGAARALNAESVPTRRGSRWTPAVIRRLLTSRHVLGEYQHGGNWHDGQHDAIIKQDTWEAAQALAEHSRKYAPKGGSGRLPANHVFVRGALRCQLCGEAMLPRSGPPETYVCRRHKSDKTACPTPVIPRAAVEVAALRLFEKTALDVEATRQLVADQLASKAADAKTLIEQAERQVAERRAALARFDRDYATGDLGAASYERLSGQYTDELAAAEAEAERLREQAKRNAAAMASLDDEGEALRRITNLRKAVARHLMDAAARPDVGALRAAMSQVFECVSVLNDDGKLYVIPWLRRDVYEGSISAPLGKLEEALEALPIRRVPIPFEVGENQETTRGVPE